MKLALEEADESIVPLEQAAACHPLFLFFLKKGGGAANARFEHLEATFMSAPMCLLTKAL